jgi:hypothetical protein
VPDITYLLDSVPLVGQWRLLSKTLFRPPVSRAMTLVEIPGVHGAIVAGARRYEAPIMTFEHLVEGDTPAELDASLGDLMSLLGVSSSITRVVDTTLQSAASILVSVSEPEYNPGAVTLTSQHRLPGVFFRGVSADTTLTIANASTPVTVTNLATSTGPITDAMLRAAGPISAAGLTVTAPGNLTGLTVTGTVPSGTYLFVDCASYRAWTSTSATAWGPAGTDVSGLLDVPSAGMLAVESRMKASTPSDRAASLLVAGTTSLTIRARKAFL